MSRLIQEIADEWRIFVDVTQFRWRDLVVFFFGAPGGLHILDSLPIPLEKLVSARVAEIIINYRTFMQETVWVPLSNVLRVFNVEIPLVYFEPASGIFALLVMIVSSIASGRKESITDMASRIVRYEENGEFDYDDGRAYFNLFTYPFALPYLLIFSLPLADLIESNETEGSKFLIAVPIFLVSAMIFGGLRGIAKSARRRGNVNPIGIRPYLFVSILAGILGLSMVLGFMAFAAIPISVWIAVAPGFILIWLLMLFLLLAYHVNWRSLPIMMIWAVIFTLI